ncbi:MAG: peptidoglycan-binding protein [Lachnospiraceae bacterium]
MEQNQIHAVQAEQVDTGSLKIQVTSLVGLIPVQSAKVTISYTGDPQTPMEQISTNANGQSELLSVPAPPLEYSMKPQESQPYAEYTVQVEAEGYRPVNVNGIDVFSGVISLQNIRMEPVQIFGDEIKNIVIPANTLFGDFPPKIAEAEIKPMEESGEIVLSRVVVPEYVVVHDGPPKDSTAKDYYVKYKDYVKNVASSEIYATWSESTIRANILAIMSFTLNRVYTEWYRNKGYDFTITSSTAYDHKWIYGRNYFDNIARIVDEIFANFLSRPNVKQPILTQYCDGERVSCPNWLSQWGSKYLGDQNYSPVEILRYYYGTDMYINEAEEISGVPASWPGEDLLIGSSGDKVRQMQEQLNSISRVYSSIPKVAVDGSFGPSTKEAVKAFQSTFGLPVSGIVDYPTWYKISEIFVGVTRIAELV